MLRRGATSSAGPLLWHRHVAEFAEPATPPPDRESACGDLVLFGFFARPSFAFFAVKSFFAVPDEESFTARRATNCRERRQESLVNSIDLPTLPQRSALFTARLASSIQSLHTGLCASFRDSCCPPVM